MIPVALTIAGSDPSGGAGLQADLKTFHQLHVYGTSAVTLLTVQNTTRVSSLEYLRPRFIEEQIMAVLEDIPPSAVKTGALGTAAAIRAVAAIAFNCPLVVDPVMISKHGAALLDVEGILALREQLLPHATLITPNLEEAACLAAMEITTPDHMKQAAERISSFGAGSVLVKGGHLDGDALDILWHNGQIAEYRSPRIRTRHTHGTGAHYRRRSPHIWRWVCNCRTPYPRAKPLSRLRSKPLQAWARAQAP